MTTPAAQLAAAMRAAEHPCRALAFIVPGAARGKGRPRATARGGHARLYTDAKTVSYENLVRFAAKAALQGSPPLEGPLELSVAVRITPAASTTQKLRRLMIDGEVYPTKKPDLDNIVKSILDGCNTVAFRDDAQVIRITAGKFYAEEPGVVVRILPARPISSQREMAA